MKKIFLLFLLLLNISAFSQVRIGDILCTDNTTVAADEFQTSGKIALGVVCFVDQSQQHGWAIDLVEFEPANWGNPSYMCYLYSFNNDPQQAYGDTIGKIRCDSITNFANNIGLPLSNFATAVNNAKSRGEGWYLPAIGQLSIMYAYIVEINYALDQIESSQKLNGRKYWSSTEDRNSYYSAWYLNFNGGITSQPKSEQAKVRAIRNF